MYIHYFWWRSATTRRRTPGTSPNAASRSIGCMSLISVQRRFWKMTGLTTARHAGAPSDFSMVACMRWCTWRSARAPSASSAFDGQINTRWDFMAAKRKVNPELIDDENPELTAADVKRMRPASEVLSKEFLDNWRKGGHTTRLVSDAEYEASKRRGRPKSENPKMPV